MAAVIANYVPVGFEFKNVAAVIANYVPVGFEFKNVTAVIASYVPVGFEFKDVQVVFTKYLSGKAHRKMPNPNMTKITMFLELNKSVDSVKVVIKKNLKNAYAERMGVCVGKIVNHTMVYPNISMCRNFSGPGYVNNTMNATGLFSDDSVMYMGFLPFFLVVAYMNNMFNIG